MATEKAVNQEYRKDRKDSGAKKVRKNARTEKARINSRKENARLLTQKLKRFAKLPIGKKGRSNQ
jgi:hypothetical protein